MKTKHRTYLGLAFMLLFAVKAQAQTAGEFFNRAARSYVKTAKEQALKEVNDGLAKYPNDAKLKALKEKLNQEQEEEQQEQKQDQQQIKSKKTLHKKKIPSLTKKTGSKPTKTRPRKSKREKILPKKVRKQAKMETTRWMPT